MKLDIVRPFSRLGWLVAGRLKASGLLAVLICAFPCWASEDSGTLDGVDQRVVLSAGPICLSSYLLDKYYHRFADDIHRRTKRLPSVSEKTAWLELFLAKQVVIAHAASLGYLDRPEVRQTVDRMERAMLTQTTGPYYKDLFRKAPLSERELEDLYTRSFTVYDSVVARFSDSATAATLLGRDFDHQPTAVQTSRVLGCKGSEGVQVVDGALSWPFEPFEELAGVVDSSTPGKWTLHEGQFGGEYRILVRNMKVGPRGDIQADRGRFEALANSIHDRSIVDARRSQILSSAMFELDGPVADQAVEFLSGATASSMKTRECPAGLRDKTLFRWRSAEKIEVVTVDDFCRHQDDLFVRRVPANRQDLRASAEDMVVGELDLRDARAARVDRAPQFMEDRRGFAELQALDLFERETLVPGITIAQSDIDSYYAFHRSEFQATSAVGGRLLEFPGIHDALVWCQTPDAKGTGVGPPPGAIRDQEVEVHSDNVAPEFEAFGPALMQAPEGARLGPVQYKDSYVVFIKERILSMSAVPLSSVADRIRGILTRVALDAKDLRLAADFSHGLVITDRVDYARYGLSAGSLLLPWRP